MQGVALLLAFVMFVLASAVGPAGGPVVSGWFALAPAAFGALSWRYQAVPWRDIASWTIPLVAWMAALVAIFPTPVLALVGLLIASTWLSLFACWSPVVPWWYAKILRRPIASIGTSHPR
jgi:hypothetical protein